jgi:hypothetical protein
MTENPAAVQSLYLNNPSFEYRQVIDLGLHGWEDQDEPVLAVVSSRFYGVELLKRTHTPLFFLATNAFDVTAFSVDAGPWAWGPLHTIKMQDHFCNVFWAEPEMSTAMEVLLTVNQLTSSGDHLRVITSGPLHHFLPAWSAAPFPARQPMMAGKVKGMLSSNGWRITRQTVLHGPRSILWSGLSRLANALRRPDLGDCCLLAMRKMYQEPGWVWPMSPLSLIWAERL